MSVSDAKYCARSISKACRINTSDSMSESLIIEAFNAPRVATKRLCIVTEFVEQPNRIEFCESTTLIRKPQFYADYCAAFSSASASSCSISPSMMVSMSPSSACSRLWIVRPIRWSVIRLCG